MKKLLSTLLTLLAGSVILFAQSVKTLDENAFEKKMASAPAKTILDVRTAEEFLQGHLANAVQVDYYKSDFRDKVSKLDKTKPIFVYCLAGGRSSSAVSIMSELGFKEIYNLEGGYRSWLASKKPVTK